LVTTIVILAIQIYEKKFSLSDALVRLSQASINLIVIFLNKKYPTHILKYHGALLVISLIPMTIVSFIPGIESNEDL
jgi:hypothetical protein